MLVEGEFVVTVSDDVPVGFEPVDPAMFEGRTDEERASVLAFLPATIDEVFETLANFADAERFDVQLRPRASAIRWLSASMTSSCPAMTSLSSRCPTSPSNETSRRSVEVVRTSLRHHANDESSVSCCR